MRSKERFRVHDFYTTNRLELFDMWLDSGKNWDSVVLQVQRKHETSHASKSGWEAKKGRTIKAEMGETKGAELIKIRTEAGMYYTDPDFPDDDNEPYPYLVESFFFVCSFANIVKQLENSLNV